MIQLSSQLLDHAKSSAEHRDSNSVSAEDLNEALDSFSNLLVLTVRTSIF